MKIFHNDLIDMTNKHQSEMKIMDDNISAMIQNLSAENSKTDNHEEQFTKISSKFSDYEDCIDKMSINETHIQTLSRQITNTSSKTDNNEVKLTEFMSKFSDYEIRLDKLSTDKIKKMDTSIKENEEKLSPEFDKNMDDLKSATSISIHPKSPNQNSHNSHSSSKQPSADITKWQFLKSPDFIQILHSLPSTCHT